MVWGIINRVFPVTPNGCITRLSDGGLTPSVRSPSIEPSLAQSNELTMSHNRGIYSSVTLTSPSLTPSPSPSWSQYSGRWILTCIVLCFIHSQSQKYPRWHLIHWGGDLVQCATEICGDIAYVCRLYIDSFETHSKLASHKLTFNTHKKAGLGEGRQQRNWSALFYILSKLDDFIMTRN